MKERIGRNHHGNGDGYLIEGNGHNGNGKNGNGHNGHSTENILQLPKHQVLTERQNLKLQQKYKNCIFSNHLGKGSDLYPCGGEMTDHHIRYRCEGGNGDKWNLVRMCRDHQVLVHRKEHYEGENFEDSVIFDRLIGCLPLYHPKAGPLPTDCTTAFFNEEKPDRYARVTLTREKHPYDDFETHKTREPDKVQIGGETFVLPTVSLEVFEGDTQDKPLDGEQAAGCSAYFYIFDAEGKALKSQVIGYILKSEFIDDEVIINHQTNSEEKSIFQSLERDDYQKIKELLSDIENKKLPRVPLPFTP